MLANKQVKTEDIKATAIVLYFSNINNDICPCAYILIPILLLESKAGSIYSEIALTKDYTNLSEVYKNICLSKS